MWTLLTEGEDGSKAMFALARNAGLRDEAAAMLPSMEAAKTPITMAELVTLMAGQRVVFGVPDMEPGEWSMLAKSYFDALQEFSPDAIRDAFRRWNRGEDMKDPAMGQFYPKPAQLYVLAKKAKSEVYVAAYRARKALEKVEADGPAWTPERKAAERQKMIDQGLLTEDGKPNFSIGGKAIPGMAPSRSPQEVAASLLAAAAGQARQFGAPVSRKHIEDPGDVV